MTRTLLLLLSLLSFQACDPPQHNNEEEKMEDLSVHFHEISYGIYQSEEISKEASDESPTGFHRYVGNLKLLKRCDTVDAVIGANFGIEYKIETPRDTTIEITKVWEIPENMVNEKGEEYEEIERTLTVTTNENSFTTYRLEKDFEILKGNWVLKFYYGNDLLYKKTFFLK